MAIGIAFGTPVLTTACFKSFAHDQFTRVMAEGVKCIAQEIRDPAISKEPVAEIDSPVPAAVTESLKPVEPEPLSPISDDCRDDPFSL